MHPPKPRWRLRALALLLLVVVATAAAQEPTASRDSAHAAIPSSSSVAPMPGWDGACPDVSETIDTFLFGGFIGLALAALPALVLGLTRFRKVGLGIALVAACGGSAFVGGLNWIIKSDACPVRYPAAAVDAQVNTDSLFRLYRRFASDDDPPRRRELARAIHCETLRIVLIEPWGRPALRLVGSRIATPAKFAELSQRAAREYGESSPGVLSIRPDDLDPQKCNRPTGMLTGRVIDAETRQPVFGMIALTNWLNKAIDVDGHFVFEIAPASADSSTLYVCAPGYELTRHRVLVRDGPMPPLEVAVKKLRLPPGESEPIDSLDAKRKACMNAAVSGVRAPLPPPPPPPRVPPA